jgi:hypothetical protein
LFILKHSDLRIIKIVTLICLLFSSNAFAFSLGSLFSFWELKPPPPKPHVVVKHPTNHTKQPVYVNVGVYILHVGKYDLHSANYNMDFYLMFNCTPSCNDVNYEIMNATDAKTQLVSKQKTSLTYRVQADLNKSDNLRNYPFDSHILDIVLENKQMTSNNMIFVPDPASTALDKNLDVVGFQLSPTWDAKVIEHYYPVFQQSFSSYKFSMFIKRPWLAAILKGIFPALIVVICNFLALFMKIEHTSQRLGIATSTLIAAEVFHLNLTASLPPLGYITYADMFMLINDFILFIVSLEVVLTIYYIESKHHIIAQRINTGCAWFIPVFWLTLQSINWMVFDPGHLMKISS